MVILGNIITLADAFQLPDLQMLAWHHEGRLNGFLGQPNEYGAFLVIFLPATVALFTLESGTRRFLAAIGALATFVCLLLTFSRGSYVGVFLGLLLGAVFLRKYVPIHLVTSVAIAIGIVSAIAIPLLFFVGFDDEFRDRFSLFGGDTHTMTTGRSTLWLRALSVMSREPISFLTGYGWYSYSSFSEFRLSVHNVYIYYLFNLGVIGLTLFLTTFMATFVKLRQGIAFASGANKSLLVSATIGIFGICVTLNFSEIYATVPLMWAFIGLALRLAISQGDEVKALTSSRNFDRSLPDTDRGL
jgi:O-antigen ligase